ncbi:unnamed protein product [Paramecium primaurelia]|uniref:Uncharacterized protein n=1 Tax=Paramecium primaurelia TaxID=5886 RepID=A0A8S1QU43_PARPR|nr:unnamed protein product [Paramecium primaurelia]
MQSVEQFAEQMRALTQQCIQSFDQFMDESYLNRFKISTCCIY